MKFYVCACAACTWKGNKPHRDGQCPVCGNALDIQIRERRLSSDLTSKVILSGLSSDQKIQPPLPDLSILKDYKISGQELQGLLTAGESIRARLVESISKMHSSSQVLKPGAAFASVLKRRSLSSIEP
ncbi:MAG: hypothetical protein L0Y38_08950 [Methylococcaceae bacterium]|nr:hypothetical protein [Methylococcaceae bacterium]MCI0667719.1 hypothetical protein [Methylococcaceae bacterium]MCI0733933.1 hypothetical protein [Methylococcaceae bacterium]